MSAETVQLGRVARRHTPRTTTNEKQDGAGRARLERRDGDARPIVADDGGGGVHDGSSAGSCSMGLVAGRCHTQGSKKCCHRV